MAKYKTDLQDINFTLFDLLKAERHLEGYEANDLKEIVAQFDKFIENEVYPTRQIGDHEGVTLTDQGVKVPACFKEPHKAFYANGWYGLGYSEELGGMPCPESVGIACTSLANGANVSFSMYYGLTKGAMNVILKIGTDAQKEKFATKMMSGEWGGTMCLTEPGAGSDVGAAKTTAQPKGDGTYAIKGVKIFISSGDNDLYDNIVHLVLARTPGAPEGTKGLSLFIVPKFNDDGSNNSVKCTKIEEKMGIHGSATCELTFGGEGECIGTMIGAEFEGMPNMFIMMNEARLLCGLQGESQANLAYMLTEQYAKERSQFGTEIINLPDVKRLLLKMRAVSRGMRALNLYVGDLFDQIHHGATDLDAEVALLTPICKAYGSEEGFNVAIDAIQVHGGYGFCSEYGIEQFARDTKIATIYEGTNAIQAADFIMRKILKDKGQAFAALGEKIAATLSRAGAFKSEVTCMGQNLKDAQVILANLGKLASEKKFDAVLYHSHDFLIYCGNLVVAWRLLEGALLANELSSGANSADKAFYETKVVDFKVFCQQFLSKNAGITQSILNFEDLSSLAV